MDLRGSNSRNHCAEGSTTGASLACTATRCNGAATQLRLVSWDAFRRQGDGCLDRTPPHSQIFLGAIILLSG